MAIITLLSDYGECDHYVAAVKAKILSINSGIRLVDISHQITSCDIAHAAHVIGSVFRDFPKGTVHFIGVNGTGQADDKLIALELEGHFFVGADNGLFGLITDQTARYVVDLNAVKPIDSPFPGKRILAAAAARLASGTALTDLGPPVQEYKRMLPRQLKANKELIMGHVLRVDHYGNLLTNIDRHTFDILSKDKNYSIKIGRELVSRIQTQVYQVEAGDLFILFNDRGFMEIGINQGRACDLLGVGYDGVVMVRFEG